MGGFEAAALVAVEPSLRYHSDCVGILTTRRYPALGQCLVGSLTGAVTSQNVTEVCEGVLRLYGNQSASVKAEGRLTASLTGRAGAKAGLSDPAVLRGRAVA